MFLVMNWRDEEDADKQIDLQLKPILESWIGGKIPLNFTRVYGVRRYLVRSWTDFCLVCIKVNPTLSKLGRIHSNFEFKIKNSKVWFVLIELKLKHQIQIFLTPVLKVVRGNNGYFEL